LKEREVDVKGIGSMKDLLAAIAAGGERKYGPEFPAPAEALGVMRELLETQRAMEELHGKAERLAHKATYLKDQIIDAIETHLPEAVGKEYRWNGETGTIRYVVEESAEEPVHKSWVNDILAQKPGDKPTLN
jgi:predicted transcriptional regulator